MGNARLSTLHETGVNTAVELHPEWSLAAEQRVEASHHRTLSGRLFSYRWGSHAAYRVPLRFVPEDRRDLLRQWWRGGERLLFTANTSADNTGAVCFIVNRQEPLGHRVRGLHDHWAGLLRLEAADSRTGLGLPFVLDHPQFGLLDQPNLSVI